MNPNNPLLEPFAYMMAAEKVTSMIQVLEQNLEFFEEYNIKPDDAVKIALRPLMEKMKDWLKDENINIRKI